MTGSGDPVLAVELDPASRERLAAALGPEHPVVATTAADLATRSPSPPFAAVIAPHVWIHPRRLRPWKARKDARVIALGLETAGPWTAAVAGMESFAWTPEDAAALVRRPDDAFYGARRPRLARALRGASYAILAVILMVSVRSCVALESAPPGAPLQGGLPPWYWALWAAHFTVEAAAAQFSSASVWTKRRTLRWNGVMVALMLAFAACFARLEASHARHSGEVPACWPAE